MEVCMLMNKNIFLSLFLCLLVLTGFYDELQAEIIDDFESSFVSVPGYGFIPPGWEAAGSEDTTFSQANIAHHGNYSLHAEVQYDPKYYSVLEKTFKGFEPGRVFDLQVFVKCHTLDKAECGFGVKQGWTENRMEWNETTHYWYENSDADWVSIILEEVPIYSDGNLVVYLKFGNDEGHTHFYIDKINIIDQDTNDQVLPTPNSQEYFSMPPNSDYTISQHPDSSNPFAFGDCATGGEMLSLKIGVQEFQEPVDLYVAVSVPTTDNEILLVLQPDHSFKHISEGLVPWKASVRSSIIETIFKDIPITILLSGSYNFYLAATPAGETDFSHYYLWHSTMQIENN